MAKNKEMLHIFFKVLFKDKNAINLVIPNSYQKNIFEINYKQLKENGYINLIFDIDNTIMPVNDTYVTDELKEFINKLKKEFNICLVSNNSLERVNPIKEKLKVLVISNANKPQKEAFDKSLKMLKSTKKNTVMIGDQMLTDIVGGNKYGLYTILVEPFKKKYDIKTGTSRILQNILMKKLTKQIKRYNYY